MRVGPLLALLLSGLGSSVSAGETKKTTVSDKEAAAAEKRGDRPDIPTRPTYLHPRDKMNGRGPVASAPLAGAKQDVTGSNDKHLSEVTEVSCGSWMAFFLPKVYARLRRWCFERFKKRLLGAKELCGY